MARIKTLPVLLFLVAFKAFAVNGISVSIAEGTVYHKYYGRQSGKLWRCTIINDQITAAKQINGGPCTRPCLSPDGKHIGFLKGNRVCVMPTAGGTVKELTTAHNNSYMDFASNEYIYYTPNGSYHEENTNTVNKIKITGGTPSRLFNLGSEDRIGQFGVSNDGTKATIRPGDNSESQYMGGVGAFDITQNKYARQVSGAWSCAVGMSSDGQYCLDGWGGHDGFDIRKWSDGSVAAKFRNTDAQKWAPNNGATSDSKHAIFHSACATNEPHWVCIVVGNSSGSSDTRNDVNKNQLLVNWKDKRCICPTKKINKPFVDHGDFWIGNPADVLDDPTAVQRRKNIERRGYSISHVGSTVYVDGAMVDEIHIVNMSGRTVRKIRPINNVTVIDKFDSQRLGSGAYIIRVMAGNRIIGSKNFALAE